MENVWLVGYVRTPIGRQGGALSRVRPDDLAAHVIAGVLQKSGVSPEEVEEVFFGCANQAGEDNRNVARMAGLLAGLPETVPGVTVNRLCASGLEAFIQAARAIQLGDLDVAIAGGVESMTRAPLVLPKPDMEFVRGNQTLWDTTLGWRMANPRFPYPTESMGETAENVAEKYGISREEQDQFALESQSKAKKAQDHGVFAEEILPVTVRQGKETWVVDTDEHPRPQTTLESLSKLKPAFREGGTVTAGNASGINDGAAALLLVSERRGRELGLRPIVRYVAAASAGVSPRYMGIGPVPATEKALKKAGLKVEDLDKIELNEAFAAQSLACIQQLNLPPERVNVHGGAIALGHPLGCSGARLVGTLAMELSRTGGRYGLATLCVGVGQGLAAIVERPE
ncbi:acetyl-CoA C-acyltransferase [Alicyclobacillus sp. TC]|uniref:acetyl-CoA C-acetyltransferase n=1 Tax=Alicyclobacillus tolerans TaxID=90970 RepID=A0A1M6PRD2_9BACL|nr:MULTISPECIES: acetyl-CoA C-acyltransferase [Alicyclobacillus]QRF22285.1 acetyl-CoA C-acyltransferase [Alicyclobacillus sp. TC]SHK10428.1 3-oxoadipyl-CoA thiolase [Alicyclobacillus montanus]